jgi:hypothetical protein
MDMGRFTKYYTVHKILIISASKDEETPGDTEMPSLGSYVRVFSSTLKEDS